MIVAVGLGGRGRLPRGVVMSVVLCRTVPRVPVIGRGAGTGAAGCTVYAIMDALKPNIQSENQSSRPGRQSRTTLKSSRRRVASSQTSERSVCLVNRTPHTSPLTKKYYLSCLDHI